MDGTPPGQTADSQGEPITPDVATSRFVQAWGALSHVWGISRAMGEIHALLFVSPEPLCTDDIMARLQISRGGANTNLRSLEEWRLVRRLHKPGDRKDYYEAEGDPWTVCWTLLDERKRREVDPILAVLRECLAQAPDDDGAQASTYRERIGELLALFEELDTVYDRIRKLLNNGSRDLIRMMVNGV